MQAIFKKANKGDGNKIFDKLIISRTGIFYTIWNFIIAILCVYSSLFYLELAAFGAPSKEDTDETLDIFFILIFFVDLLVRLNLDYYDKVKEITVRDQPKVALNYLRTNFFFDFITTIPFVRIFQAIYEFPN